MKKDINNLNQAQAQAQAQAQVILNAANNAALLAEKAVTDAKLLVTKAEETAARLISPNSQDHDLIIRLDTKLDDLKVDIKELKDGTASKISDHEIRIKSLEISMTKVFTFGVVGLIILGIIQFLIGKFL